MTFCGSTVLPTDFDILRPFSSSVKPWVSTMSNGARPRVPQLSSSEDWNQPRCWSEPSRYITVSRAAIDLALDAGEARKMHGVFQHESVGRAGIEPDVADVVDLLPFLVGVRAEKAFARAVHVPGVGAFFFEGVGDALVDGGVLQDLGRAVALLAHEHRDRHAPGALARDHPVGLAVDHAVDAVLPGLRHPLGHGDRVQRAGAQGVAGFGALPLSAMSLSIAMNHCGVLRKITGFFERQECGY